jgi:sulfate adenylyltransferase subunit 2
MNGHLKSLEAEAIGILREARACFARPVLLYSIGKDSSVLYRLARKAFAPAPLPFPLLHVDTSFKFREMIEFRDSLARQDKFEIILAQNTTALEAGMNPFDYDASSYTAAMKTAPLRNIIDEKGFDVAIGGARRDEERSRAKERIFSLRGPGHVWDPRNQRPEFFEVHNTALPAGSTMRCFPLSNWTELDVWQYILAEGIEIVPLYFAKEREVVRRGGQLILRNDDRLRLGPDEEIEKLRVRFRTLGCYPLTAAVESGAETVSEIIEELMTTKQSERSGRIIDHVGSSMEDKKREGYF